MPEKDIAGLEGVQICLARVLTKAPRFSRSAPIQLYSKMITLASFQVSQPF